jgi:hypothetical protein
MENISSSLFSITYAHGIPYASRVRGLVNFAKPTTPESTSGGFHAQDFNGDRCGPCFGLQWVRDGKSM